MICPACKVGIMEMIVEGVLHCPDCNHFLKEKEIIADGREDLLRAQGRVRLRPQRRVVDNWDEFQNITPIWGLGADEWEDQEPQEDFELKGEKEPDIYHQEFDNEAENNYNEPDTEINYIIDKKTINKEYDIQKIKEEIKNIDWENVEKDWIIKDSENQYSDNWIQIDPKQNCLRTNPLYQHKKWLKQIYNDKNLNLSDRMIGKICGVSHKTIGKWRKKFNIRTKKESGRYVDSLRGYNKNI